MAQRNSFQAGLNRAWYRKGLAAGKSGRSADMYAAWQSAKGKPTISGKRVTAQESFFQGWYDGTKRNPAGSRRLPMNKWIRGAGLRVRRSGGRLVVDVQRMVRSNPKRKDRIGYVVYAGKQFLGHLLARTAGDAKKQAREKWDTYTGLKVYKADYRD